MKLRARGLFVVALLILAVPTVDTAEIDSDKLKVGPVELHPHAAGSFTYDDNIYISNGRKKGDFYGVVSPGLQLLYGREERNQISLDYQANIQEYAKYTSENAVDHMAALRGAFEFNKLSLNVSQTYTRATGGETRDPNGMPTEQVGERIYGSRVSVEQYVTALSAEYNYSSKTAFGFHYDQSFSSYDTKGLIGNEQYRLGAPIYYHVTSKTDIYAELNGGFVNVDQGANSTYEQLRLGARTKMTGKLLGFASVGYEHRDFDSKLEDAMNSVVADMGLSANLTRHLSATLTVARAVNPAATAINTSYTSTYADAALDWKIWHDKIVMTIGGGYERDDYTTDSAGLDRKDDYWTARWRCNYNIKKWWQVGVEYRYRTTESSFAAANFDNNLVSLYTRLTF